MRQVQERVLDLIEDATDGQLRREVAPDWLNRPGKAECGPLWPTITAIYYDLTGMSLPDVMPPRERRRVDAVFVGRDGRSRIVEVDEVQHFTPQRAQTLSGYPPTAETAFDREAWRVRSAAVTKLRGGGWGRPCPPLFPEQGGRHGQRAFRDALADLLPPVYGWAPTLRIGDFEVLAWLDEGDAAWRMANLLRSRGMRDEVDDREVSPTNTDAPPVRAQDVVAFASAWFGEGPEAAQRVTRVGFGWLVETQPLAFIESGDVELLSFGNGPILVDRRTGDYWIRSSSPIDVFGDRTNLGWSDVHTRQQFDEWRHSAGRPDGNVRPTP